MRRTFLCPFFQQDASIAWCHVLRRKNAGCWLAPASIPNLQGYFWSVNFYWILPPSCGSLVSSPQVLVNLSRLNQFESVSVTFSQFWSALIRSCKTKARGCLDHMKVVKATPPKCLENARHYHITWCLEPVKQALLASRDVMISSQICGTKLQSVFTLGDRCWLLINNWREPDNLVVSQHPGPELATTPASNSTLTINCEGYSYRTLCDLPLDHDSLCPNFPTVFEHTHTHTHTHIYIYTYLFLCVWERCHMYI